MYTYGLTLASKNRRKHRRNPALALVAVIFCRLMGSGRKDVKEKIL